MSKKFSLSGLFGFLESKGVKVKLNEGASDEDQQFELIEEDIDEDTDTDQGIEMSQFSTEEVAGIKNLLAGFADTQPEAFANALKGIPTALAFIQNAEEVQRSEKAILVSRIIANSASLFLEEELAALPVGILQKMDAQSDVNYMAAGGGTVFENSSNDDEPLQPKSTFMVMAEKESV